MKSPLYYNPGTPSSGSADPLRHAMQMRSVLRTGWGPRGDSGSARGRVRATQPASFFFCFPLHFTSQSTREEGLHPGSPFLLRQSVTALHPTVAACTDISISCSQMSALRITSLVQSERFARQVKAINYTAPRVIAFLLAALALQQISAPVAQAGEPALPKLKTETQGAFERYLTLAEARNEGELRRGTHLMWVDGLPEEQRAEAYAALKRGEVKMRRLEIFDSDKSIPCPGGMIHHWTGVVFIPGAKLEEVLGVLEDYDRHSAYYAPDVEQSKLESREGDHFRVFLRFRRHKVITVVLNTEHEVRYFRDAPGRAHSRSSAVRIAEVVNAGKSDEREKTPGNDDGFMWRMETWWRMEERDGGVYVQSEVASLTRDIPTGLGWMIKPFVTDIPKESLTFTLQATRKAADALRTRR